MATKKDVAEFCKRYGISEEQFYGRETVGGYLYLGSVTTLPEGFDPTVGGDLYWKGGSKRIGAHVVIPRPVPPILTWRGGLYMKVDGVFTEIVSKRGNVYRTRRIGKKTIGYLVTNGEGAWSHGDTLAEAKADLVYKLSSRSLDAFKDLDPDEKMDFARGVNLYRAVTGACLAGCKAWVEQNGISTRKKYSVNEILKLTQGAYNNSALVNWAKGLDKKVAA